MKVSRFGITNTVNTVEMASPPRITLPRPL